MVNPNSIAQVVEVNIKDFNEPVTIEGFYNLCEFALDVDKPILILGARYGDCLINPSFVIPERLLDNTIKLHGFECIVSPNDEVSPITVEGGNDNGT